MHRTTAKSARFVFACVAAISFAPGARSAEPAEDLLNVPFTISLGTFLLDTKTEISLDGSGGGSGTLVDFEKDLGLGDADRFRVDATWRFAPRHKVRAMYFSMNQGATRSLERSITVGDTVYPVAAQVSSTNSTEILELAYEYVFLRRADYEVAASAGIHAVDFNFRVSGNGNVGGVGGQFSSESAVAQAPLPVFGVRGLWQFSPQWYLDGQVQYFSLKYDPYDGRVTDLRIGLTRMFGKHFGIGAGWNEFITSVKLDKERFDGELKWKYAGAQLFLTAAF